MRITLEQLTERRACINGLKYFTQNFGAEAETDEIIKKLLEQKTTKNWIAWLAKEFKLTTVCKRWYENGQLSTECPYKDGERDGVCKEWRDDGRLDAEYFYKNGALEGVSNYRYVAE